jgi:amino acid transporter
VFLKGNWSLSVFVTDYLLIVFFPILYVAAKLIMGVHTVKADEMDFVTNVAEFNAMTCVPLYCGECNVRARETDQANRYDDPPAKNKLEAFWIWLVCTASSLHFLHVLTLPFA